MVLVVETAPVRHTALTCTTVTAAVGLRRVVHGGFSRKGPLAASLLVVRQACLLMYHCPNPVVADIVHCPAMVLLDGRVRHRRRLPCLSVLCCAGCCAVRVAAAAMANELALFAGACGRADRKSVV